MCFGIQIGFYGFVENSDVLFFWSFDVIPIWQDGPILSG